jgi:hypothetical protein
MRNILKTSNLPTCQLNDLLFPVEMAKISDKLGMDTISSTEYGIFAKINGKDMLLNTCSETYELVKNEDIFPVVEKLLTDAGIDYDVEYGMHSFSRFYAHFRIKTGGVSVGNKKDMIYPILILEHSYNGLWKYKMTFGYFRLVCSNGLVVPVEGKEEMNYTITGKHTAKILSSLEGLLEKIQYFNKNTKKFSEKFVIVAERWVSKWEERVEAVIEATGVGKRGYAQIVAQIEKESKELYNGKVNDWLIYNGINYHIFNAVTDKGKVYETAINLRRDADKKVWETIFNNPRTADLKKKKLKTVTAE